MATAQTHDDFPQAMSVAEYFALSDASTDTKYEYARGKVYAMAGASWRHNVINSNTNAALHGALRGKPCTVVSSDTRLKVDSDLVSFRYPDLLVVCGEPNFVEDRTDTIDNPTVVIEILSLDNALQDFNDMLNDYAALPTVQSYVVIAQNEAKVMHYARQSSGKWLYEQKHGLDSTLTIPSLDVTLALADIYETVTFDQADKAE
ncbi:MAG: Uma2 family endonuclease [Chloroflexota bacterium]